MECAPSAEGRNKGERWLSQVEIITFFTSYSTVWARWCGDYMAVSHPLVGRKPLSIWRSTTFGVYLSDPDSANYGTGQEARDIARRINEAMADIVQISQPIWCGRDIGRSGYRRCAGRDCLCARYLEDGRDHDVQRAFNDAYLGELQSIRWFEELNRREATLFVHPRLRRQGRRAQWPAPSVIEFMFDTTR